MYNLSNFIILLDIGPQTDATKPITSADMEEFTKHLQAKLAKEYVFYPFFIYRLND